MLGKTHLAVGIAAALTVTQPTTLAECFTAVIGVLKCKNPRCITSVEVNAVHEFRLADKEKKVYRCIYCEHMASK